jgi:hypothetical protein
MFMCIVLVFVAVGGTAQRALCPQNLTGVELLQRWNLTYLSWNGHFLGAPEFATSSRPAFRCGKDDRFWPIAVLRTPD